MSERIKSENVVKEFNDPLSKKQVKREKKLKVSEAYSITERELFQEAETILKRRKHLEEEKERREKELVFYKI